MTKISMKEASKTLGDTVTKFKTARDEGTMTPEEVIKTVDPIIEMALSIAEIGSEIQESVPAGNGIGDGNGLDNGIGNDNHDDNNNIDNPLNSRQHGAILTDEEKQEEEKNLNQRLSQLTKTNSQLQAQIDDMKEEKEKEKLAQKYAQLFPVPMRESKIKEFMAREGNVGILEAQVKEAESLMGTQQALRQAQIEEGTFDLSNYDDNTSNNVNSGGKY